MVRRMYLAMAAAGLALGLTAPSQAAETEGRKTVTLLQELIAVDTSNPPGDTRPTAARLQALFDAAGIENETILAPNGKAAHFIARLHGDGTKRPLLLAAHTDVVPADPKEWSVDPFSGAEKGGFIWGRGAIDNKGAVAAFARAMIRLKQSGVPLARDVIFLAEADEEQGQYNTSWLAGDHWSKIDAEFALNEGGRILSAGGKVKSFTISYADKQTLNLRLKTSGVSGHSSRPLPLDQTANGQLLDALEKLSRHETKVQVMPEVRTYLQALAAEQTGAFPAAVKHLLSATDPADQNTAVREMVAADTSGTWGLEGLVRNTVVVTMLSSGVKPNVIPGSAEAVINARLLPGVDPRVFIAELKQVIGNPRVEIELISSQPKDKIDSYLADRAKIAPSSLDTDLYRALERRAKAAWPGVKVAPTLLVASTDATPWRQRGVPVYGIAPFPMDAEQAAGVHGADERIGVRAIEEGSEFVFRVIRDVAAKAR